MAAVAAKDGGGSPGKGKEGQRTPRNAPKRSTRLGGSILGGKRGGFTRGFGPTAVVIAASFWSSSRHRPEPSPPCFSHKISAQGPLQATLATNRVFVLCGSRIGRSSPTPATRNHHRAAAKFVQLEFTALVAGFCVLVAAAATIQATSPWNAVFRATSSPSDCTMPSRNPR